MNTTPTKKAAPKKAASKKAASKKAAPKKAAAKKAAAKKAAAKKAAAKKAAAKKAAPRKPTPKKKPAPTLQRRYDAKRLSPLVDHALRGDAHAILGFAPATDLRTALSDPPEWGEGSYEKLLALYIADATREGAIGSVIYDFAEHTYLRYDDDGYLLSHVNTDLAALHAKDARLLDEAKAVEFLEAALAGPYPKGVKDDLLLVLASTKTPLPTLRAKVAAISDEEPEFADD